MKARIILTALLFLAAVTAKAENTWSITPSTSGSETTFTISRSGDTSISETVIYRFVGLSAYAGQHFVVSKINGNSIATSQQTAALSGTFTFASSETSKSVTIKEMAAGTAAYTYQNGTTRSYKLEVTDQGGFLLKEQARNFTTGTQVPSSNPFAVKDVTINSGEVTVTAAGYAQAYHSMTVDNYFNNAAPKAYFQHVGAQLRMTLTFQCKEVDDGWQYVQIYANQSTSNVDTGAGDGNPGACSYAKYVAGFEHMSSSADTGYKSYTFPVTSAENNAGATNPWGHGTGYNLHKQIFNSSRASDGQLIIPTNLTSLYVRYNASGSGGDDWVAKNTVAHIQAVDGTAPTKLAVSVAPGYHAKGNTVYVSVAFSEIVTTSDAKLTTNWGTLSYNTGSGSNVLTFKGTIQSGASGTLEITSTSGTIKDLANNNFSGSLIQSLGTTLDASYAYSITYNLNGGSVDTANPTSYTWETATFTLNNPTRVEGPVQYIFDGWTGSNGNTKQTTVTIDQYSHGNKSYTANWTPVWTGSGSQGDPYTITTTQGLDVLAQYVNSGNDCSGLFFQLGGNIEYSYYTAWNANLNSSTYANFTPIGKFTGTTYYYFNGTFDGNGHTISGIRVYYTNNFTGLFGNIGAGGTVKNVTLTDAHCESNTWGVGGIAGQTKGVITNCHVKNNVCVISQVNDSKNVGGIVGYISASTGSVSGCTSAVTIAGSSFSTTSQCGGIVGRNHGGTVSDCFAYGVSLPNTTKYVGTIVGKNDGSNASTALARNYYYGCTMDGAAVASGLGCGIDNSSSGDVSDNDGAMPVFKVSFNTSGISTQDPILTIDDCNYHKLGTTVTLNYAGNVPAGYSAVYTVTKDGTNPAETVEVTGSTFTIPEADVTVTANVLPVVSYIDADGTEQSHVCTPIVAGTTRYGNSANAEGWYVVNSDVTFDYSGTIKFLDQQVNIILCDGVTLTNKSLSNVPTISVENGSLIIYGQSLGTGSIMATNDSDYSYAIQAKSGIDINGGVLIATAQGSVGIYSSGNNSNITIRRGSVTAQGSSRGILAYGSLTILGGDITATASDSGDNIYGILAYEGDVSIMGGNVTANGSIGIKAAGSITLGCPTAADRIYASSYDCATLNVASGQTLTDGNSAHSYSGTLNSEQKAAIAGKTLMKALGPVSYIDEDGTEQTCTEYTILCDVTIPIDNYDRGTIGADDQDTWYVATGNYTFNHDRLYANGHVHLILCDGATFTVIGNYYGISASNLTIYGQSEGTGSLVASTTNANTAQGAIGFSSALTINGGNVSASCAYLAGIVGDTDSILTINGGNVNASGDAGGIFTDGDVTLGWTRATDRIYVSSYNCDGTISIKSGQAFSNGSEILSGVITDMSKLDGKTLVPATNAVAYIDADGSTKYCTEYTTITSSDGNQSLGTDGGTHWYVVSGDVTINGRLKFDDSNSHIIICDGTNLTINVSGKDALRSDDRITFYGQALGSGTINATGDTGIYLVGPVTINGGIINATGTNNGGYGIFGHGVTINGGTINATGIERGIMCDNLTLGWTKPTDRITANSYYCDGTISIKSGLAFSNGTEVLSGTITDMSMLDGKTLIPVPADGEVSLSLNAYGAKFNTVTHYWTTFYHANWNYRLPYGAQAFILKDDNVLYRVGDGTIVPAGCAVVIMCDTLIITLTATTDDPVGVSAGLLEANILRGVSASINCGDLVPGSRQVYVLGSTNNNLSFKRLNKDHTVPANKAYYVK